MPAVSIALAADKDRWNRSQPLADGAQFLHYFAKPLLAQQLPGLYPGVFPRLAAYTNTPPATRPDIETIFLTGIPAGVITPAPTFTNYNGTGTKADLLRLNTAIPPSSSPNSLGLLGLDVAGYPHGRRVFDDVATIALRAVAGATLGFVDPKFTPDAATGIVDFGLTTTADGTDLSAKGTEHYLPAFPYLGVPHSGYSNPNVTPISVAPLGPWNTPPSPASPDRWSSTSAATSAQPSWSPHHHSPGVEIEIRRLGEPWTGRHVAVRARHLPDETVHAGVFEALKHGRYQARIRDNDQDQPPCQFQVEGGRVTSAELGILTRSAQPAAQDQTARFC